MRRSERHDYRHFPPEYTELLTRFDHTGSIRFGPMTERRANAMRREWYRYTSFLRNAPTDDDYARSLYAIAANMVWSVSLDTVFMVEPPDSDIEGERDAYFLNAYLNPIVAAMRQTQSQEPLP